MGCMDGRGCRRPQAAQPQPGVAERETTRAVGSILGGAAAGVRNGDVAGGAEAGAERAVAGAANRAVNQGAKAIAQGAGAFVGVLQKAFTGKGENE